MGMFGDSKIMKEILISFIVPVYKVEEYLDDCIKSIVKNNKFSCEIILVDDGSPDNCGTICDSWAEKDDRIKVIHKNNGGLSDARNVGLDSACGRYVWFVDSDDWLASNAMECLISTMNENPDADVYSTPLKYYLNGIYQKVDFVPKDLGTMTGRNYINNNFPTGAIQRFIIKRSLLDNNNLRFIKGVIHEDGPFGFMLMFLAQSVVVLPQSIYSYRQRENSIMHSLKIRSSNDTIYNHKVLMSFCEKIDNSRDAVWFRILSSSLLYYSYSFVIHLFGTKEFNEFEKNNISYIKSEIRKVLPYVNLKKKMKYLLFYFSPKNTVRFYNLISKIRVK